MAGNALLIDTDIFIDYLKGILPARALIDSGGFDLYYSAWTRKELLAKPGLRESERREVERCWVDLESCRLTTRLRASIGHSSRNVILRGLRQADAIIAATAWQKGIPLLTRNQKHFRFIAEIEMVPVYGP